MRQTITYKLWRGGLTALVTLLALGAGLPVQRQAHLRTGAAAASPMHGARGAVAAPFATCTWNGAAGDWTDTSKWTSCGGNAPGAADTAIISSGTVTVSTSVTVGTLQLTGGVLNGAGALTVNTAMTWGNATMSGAGSTNLASGATLNLTAFTFATLDGRTFNNAGTANFSGTGTLALQNQGVFNNQASGVFNLQSTGTLQAFGTGPNVFNNAGTVRKTVGGTHSFGIVFNNNNVFELQTGTLSLNGGGSSSGPINLSAGAVFAVDSFTFTLNQGAAINGTGTFQVNQSGILTVEGNVTCAAPFNHNTGLVNGTGAFTATGGYNWTGGNMAGTGSTNIPAAASLNVTTNSPKAVDGRTLNLAGTTNANSLNFTISNHGTVNNQAGAVFTFAIGGFGSGTNDPTNVFNNFGTLRKTDNGTTQFSAVLNNSGTFELQAGTLSLNTGGGVSSGTMNVASGATLNFQSNYTLSTGAALNGTGTYQLVNSPTLTVAGNATCAATFTQASGTLTGAGNFTVTGTYNWQNGTMSGAGSTNIGASATLNLAGTGKTLDGRTLNNAGTATLGNSFSLVFANQATLNNQAGALFNFQNDVAITAGGAQPGTFKNFGTARKTSGTSTNFQVQFINNNIVEVQTGDFQLSAGGSISGPVNVSAGAQFTFINGTATLSAGAALNGAGTFQLNNGTLDVAANITCGTTFVQTGGTLTGAGAFTASSTYNWQGGTMSGAGSTNIAAGAALNITTASVHSLDGRTLNNAGTATFGGTGGLSLQNQAVFNNQAAGVFIMQTDADISGGTFNNAGTWRKTAGAETQLLGVFNHTGTFEVQTGPVTLNGGGVGSSAFNVNNAATLSFGNYTLNTGAALNGAGTYLLPNLGTLSIAGNVACNATFTHNGGTLGGGGTFTANTVYNWQGGTMSGNGVTVISATAALNMTVNSGKTLDTRTLNNAGTALLNATTVGLANNAVINNQAGALFELQGGAGIAQGGAPSAVVFNNQGSVRKTATGDTIVTVPFNNSNQVEITAGTLTFGQFTQTAGSTVLSGGGLGFTLAGQLQGGTLGGAGNITGNLNNSGGTVSPGLSPGLLTITGTYAQGPNGKLNIELGGLTAGTQYDRLAVSGAVALAGTLNVTTINGFVPAFGNNFVIATFGARAGTFTTLNLPNGLPAFHTATSIVLGGCPTSTITPATLPNGTAGTFYNQPLSVTGNAAGTTFAISAGTLPAGLSLSAQGVLSGTPTTPDQASFTVQAIAPSGCLGERAYTLTINPTCPTNTITPTVLLGSVIGANYNQPLGVTGGTGTTVFSVASGSLPAGLTLSPAGLLAGTITVSGQFNFSVRALDATNCLGERGYTLNVSASCPTNTITPTTLPSATAGTSYNQALTVTGGAGAVFTVVGTLPSGLTLSQAGVLTGTPTVFGQFNFSVRALSVNGCLGERAYTLTISPACGTLTINPNPLPDATVAVNYNQPLTASGGTAPYSFTLDTGTLPTGLTLSSAGVLSGTTSANGTHNFTVKATDANGCTGTRAYTLTVGCPSITVNPATLPIATAGVPFAQTFAQTGGSGAIAWSVSAGALPNGMTLNASTGALSGMSPIRGVFSFTIKATDANGCFGTRSLTFNIRPKAKADFDGDGKSDLSVWTGATGNWMVSNSGNNQVQNLIWGAGYEPYNDVIVPGDYDGDGKADQAIWRGADSIWYIRKSSDGQPILQLYGTSNAPYFDIPTPGDFDGDGKTDLAVWRRDGTWFVRRSSDNTNLIVTHGQNGDVPIAADYDGDGKCDFAVFRPAAVAPAPNWFILQSSTNTVLALQWGAGYAPFLDMPVPADYDGDGKADLAIWRGADSVWYIRPSANPNAPILQLWGTSNAPYFDIPTPADYDGDGKADIAVWRRDGTWFVLRSSNNTYQIVTHGQQGDVPVTAKGVW